MFTESQIFVEISEFEVFVLSVSNKSVMILTLILTKLCQHASVVGGFKILKLSKLKRLKCWCVQMWKTLADQDQTMLWVRGHDFDFGLCRNTTALNGSWLGFMTVEQISRRAVSDPACWTGAPFRNV